MRYAFLLTGLLFALLLNCDGAKKSAANTTVPTPTRGEAAPVPAASPAGELPDAAQTAGGRGGAAQTTAMPTKRRIRDLEFEVTVRAVEGGKVVVNYRVKNLGEVTYLLFNQGDTELGLGRGQVYVEPQPDGTVELSQRNFLEPKDRHCPEREAPIYHGVTALKPGQMIAEEIAVALPLKYRTPYADCPPLPPMPDPVRRVKFCLGAVEADVGKTTVGEREVRIVKDRQLLTRQELLCGDVVELPPR